MYTGRGDSEGRGPLHPANDVRADELKGCEIQDQRCSGTAHSSCQTPSSVHGRLFVDAGALVLNSSSRAMPLPDSPKIDLFTFARGLECCRRPSLLPHFNLASWMCKNSVAAITSTPHRIAQQIVSPQLHGRVLFACVARRDCPRDGAQGMVLARAAPVLRLLRLLRLRRVFDPSGLSNDAACNPWRSGRGHSDVLDGVTCRKSSASDVMTVWRRGVYRSDWVLLCACIAGLLWVESQPASRSRVAPQAPQRS